MKTLTKKKISVKTPIKKATHFHMRVFSRHPSVAGLRNSILVKGKKVVYRHGSFTEGDYFYEINSVESVKNSADKLKMKQCFDKGGVSHANWIQLNKITTDKKGFDDFLKVCKFPENMLIIKQRHGSRGRGNYLVKTKDELNAFVKLRKESLDNYIIEQYKNFSIEYRIHVSEHGYFYTCRKVLKKDTPKSERFQRHDDNCSWLIEENPGFEKPKNWNEIVDDCIKALRAIGADVLAFDVKCSSPKNSKDGKVKWILIESCSAPSFGDITLKKYKVTLPQIIKEKYKLETYAK